MGDWEELTRAFPGADEAGGPLQAIKEALSDAHDDAAYAEVDKALESIIMELRAAFNRLTEGGR